MVKINTYVYLHIYFLTTVEPPKSRQDGTIEFVPYSEVWPYSEVVP